MRANSLQELVYKQGQAGITKATVSIVFDNTEKDRGPVRHRAGPPACHSCARGGRLRARGAACAAAVPPQGGHALLTACGSVARVQVGYEAFDELTVTRQLVIGGRSKYLINGKVAEPS